MPETLTMNVLKRSGDLEPVDPQKILKAVERHSEDLRPFVDPQQVAQRTIDGLYDGCSTRELDWLSIRTSASLISEEPEYSKLAARMLSDLIHKEVEGQEIFSFSQSIVRGYELGLISDRTAAFVATTKQKLNRVIDDKRDDLFEYFGLSVFYDRYLLRHPITREVIETPQQAWMRVACGLSQNANEAVELYRLISSFEFMFSTPHLLNSGTSRPQHLSCVLHSGPKEDSLEGIFNFFGDVAMFQKYASGTGVSVSKIRSRGSRIAGTNGESSGVTPWMKILDSTVLAVNQSGSRPGACAVFLDTWHNDLMEFLELRDNTGDINRRTFNLFLANWIPDIFMQRVKADGIWSFFDPKEVPNWINLYGDDFTKAYEDAERRLMYTKQMSAREVYARMMKTLAESGNGWMCFKDTANDRSNQTGLPGNVIHSSNLCTEILEVNDPTEVSVCDLGSINLSQYIRYDNMDEAYFDWAKLAKNVQVAVKYLDRAIDVNMYTVPEAEKSNLRWRPIGLGVMGLQDLLMSLRLPFDSEEAREISTRISKEIYYNALVASVDLAEEAGQCPAFPETRFAQQDGEFQFERAGILLDDLEDRDRWEALRERIQAIGTRNSLLIAIAPTATIGSITGAYESIEPAPRMLFRRETLSGDFVQICKYLVWELRKLGLWDQQMRDDIKRLDGTVQAIDRIPAELRAIYKTAWELSMRPLVDMAAERLAWIDQSASTNLFVEDVNIGKLSSLYAYVWEKKLPTTYYLRSRAATGIAKTTIESVTLLTQIEQDVAAIMCSLENPESCSSCQ